jgi:exo-beta-1,3-glucanase (GH17 family)
VETEYSTVTDVVTVTANNAVVWVDQFNNILSTEYQGNPTPTTLPSSSDSISVDATATFATAAAVASPADPSTETPDTSATAATSIPDSVFSVYYPPAEETNSPVPLTTDDLDDTATAAPMSAEPSDTAASDNRIANKGPHWGNGGSNSGNGGANWGNNAAGGGFGIDFELIGSSGCKSQTELNTELGFLSTQGFSKIRFYDIGCDLSVATAAAAAAGFSVTLGLNGIGNVYGDLQTLIGMIKGNWGPIDTVVIGNEVINQGGTAGQIADAVNSGRSQLQAAGYTKNVVAVDTFMAHTAYPQICQASDYCAVNAHAFFDANTVAANAGTFVQNAIANIQTNGKAIIVTESGWPYQGAANGLAIPSPENQQAALASLKTAFAGNPGGLFLFQAYDASYKAPGAFGVEPYFGIYGH